MVGKKLGHYEIVAAIGAGGMGEVYRARDTRLDRTVAIKILPPHLAERPELRARLEREARVVSGLSHPNICTLYDIGDSEGVFFLVMEYLEGETLAQRLGRERVPTETALRTGAEIGAALQRAHRAGVIHRDLKPGNVMLTKDGAKLLDFGLAKAAEPTSDSGVTGATRAASEPLTERGTILGTFQYMAPEQLEGHELDARTDIFAFGAVLYEMFTGQKAFEGKSRASLIAAILEREPRPISELQPLSPPALDRVIRRCLAKNPDDRWQSAGDVASELRWIMNEGSRAGVPRVVSERRRGRERIAWAVCAVLATAIPMGLMTFRKDEPRPRVVRTMFHPPAGFSCCLDATRPGIAAISPDGSRIVFAAMSDQDRVGLTELRLYVRDLDALEARPLAGTEGARYPFWSPDGREVAFFTGEELKRVEIAGGPAFPICTSRNGKGGTWSADGTIVFAPTWDAGLSRVSPGGGDLTPLTTLDSTRAEDSHRFPSFLPDGRRFVYFARGGAATDGSRTGTILLGSLDGETPREITRSESQAIIADGCLLFVRERSLYARAMKGDELRGDPVPLAQGVQWSDNAMLGAFSAVPGMIAYHPTQAQSDVEIRWCDANGRALSTVGEKGPFRELRVSPDGQHIALVDEDSDIWIADAVTGARTRFAAESAIEYAPVWSPDSKSILFASSKNHGVMDFFRKSLTGTSAEELVYESPESETPTSWSSDGNHIAFERAGDLWVLPLDTGEPSLFAKGAEGGFFSPDGRWLLYTAHQGTESEAVVAPFPATGRTWRISTRNGFAAGWWNEGAAVVHYEEDSEQVIATPLAIDGSTLRVGAPSVLAQSPGDVVFAQPHGNRFAVLVAMTPSAPSPIIVVQNWKELVRRRS